jgi:hypothetical protein
MSSTPTSISPAEDPREEDSRKSKIILGTAGGIIGTIVVGIGIYYGVRNMLDIPNWERRYRINPEVTRNMIANMGGSRRMWYWGRFFTHIRVAPTY